MALWCVLLAVPAGIIGSLHYLPAASEQLNAGGLSLTQLRPLHTSFASLWIFGASLAVIYHWLSTQHGGLDRGDRLRFRFHTACWLTAGVGIFVSLLLRVTSGREYLDFHPAFSVLLLAGWLAYAWTFLRRLRYGFWAQPIYVWFWTVGTLYFVYTFLEGHAYLLPSVFGNPVRDLQLQWKSCGTLVGSFNFLMYGSLAYVGERLTGDKRYAQSATAFWLFGVGCLNSFTNYVHHTYHLPQTHVVKWVAFVVSMMELVILLKVMVDLARAVRRRAAKTFCGRASWLTSAKWWTAGMLLVSVLISVPNLNSIIHGTQVVMGHAMGATIGIDTMVLLGTASWLIGEALGRPVLADLDCPLHRSSVVWISYSLLALVGWLTVSGTTLGIYRYLGEPTPEWVIGTRWVLPVAGSMLGCWLVVVVVRLLLFSHRGDPRPEAAH
jgi:nitric oxide reductase subunit B